MARDQNSETNAIARDLRTVTIAEHRYPIRPAESTAPSYRVFGMHNRPVTELDAQMSIPYTIAVGLLRDGKVRMEDFHPRNYKNPKIQALADKITAESAPDLSAGTPRRPITMPAEATLKTKSGRTFQKRIDRHKGDPRNPLSQAELIEKFAVCVKGSLSDARKQRALEPILSLEKAKDVSKLMRCLVRS